ncbi:hypothetical protein PENTCL1PPCAC_26699, partial [Pristionchus entomophagus]
IDTNGSRLSTQMLLTDDYNHHCEGGETFRAMESAENDGIVTETSLPHDESQYWTDIDPNATRYTYERACVITRSHRDQSHHRDPNRSYSWITIPAVSHFSSSFHLNYHSSPTFRR